MKTDENINTDLDMVYRQARMKYYRHTLHKQERENIEMLQKIPDDWNSVDPDLPIASISIDQKRKLSFLKIFKSKELKFETRYFYYLTTAEQSIISLMQQHELSETELDEAIESIKALSFEENNSVKEFKKMIASLAKRQVSDFYYLMISYFKFNKIISKGFDKDFMHLKNLFISYIKEHRIIHYIIENIISMKTEINKYYEKNSAATGWVINEKAIRALFESDPITIIENSELYDLEKLKRIVSQSFSYTTRLKKDFLFLIYYYNESDGKLFRINYVINSFQQKLIKGKISREIFNSLLDIRKTFLNVKNNLEWNGLKHFGLKGAEYGEIIEIIYRSAKIIEQSLVLLANYDDLINFREEMLFKIESDYFNIYPERRKH